LIRVSTALANFLFEAANFLLLAAALGWLLFKPVRAALDAERERHAEEERKAAELRKEAQALAEQAREARQRAAAEIERERGELLAAAQKEARRIKEEARKTQGERLQALERDFEERKSTHAALLAETLGRVAAAALRRLLEALDGPSLDLALVRGACQELRALPEAARGAAVVEAARPLEEGARRLLQEVLGDPFEERTVPELGAGVRVITPAGQIDASALALARQVAREVARAAADVPRKAESPHD
jgi:F0F1-type ATP synthase membrane subunit b/b'